MPKKKLRSKIPKAANSPMSQYTQKYKKIFYERVTSKKSSRSSQQTTNPTRREPPGRQPAQHPPTQDQRKQKTTHLYIIKI